MPFLHRPVLIVLFIITAFFLLSYFSVSSLSFTFSPLLFPSTTLITLTDDNSTFFVSRPAAFGPQLSKSGVVGELYVLEDGNLACGEAAGFDSRVHSIESQLPELADDGTDNIVSSPAAFDEIKFDGPVVKMGDTPVPTDITGAEVKKPKVVHEEAGEGVHADIESMQESAAMDGKIVLVKRGGCGFLEKVLWAQRRGAAALIVGDNEPGRSLITMYAKGDTSIVTIPSIFTSHTTAHILISLLPQNFRFGVLVRHPLPSMSKSVELPTEGLNEEIPSTVKASFTAPTISKEKQEDDSTPPKPGNPKQPTTPPHEGLWLTLTPGGVSSSPFFDTLLVMVVSPLITLTIVYTMLTIRSHLRRRRWRAPKSYVERLPVRTYHPGSPSAEEPEPCWRSAGRMEEGRRGRSTRRREFRGQSNECVVCLEEYVDGVSRVMKLPCGHEFHEGCITPWLITRRRTCPICKGDVVRYMDSSSIDDEDSDVEDEVIPPPPQPQNQTQNEQRTPAREQRERRGSAGSHHSAAGEGGNVTERTPLVNGE